MPIVLYTSDQKYIDGRIIWQFFPEDSLLVFLFGYLE
jgi:hypothetical protein